jgi:MATE family multidrug resistance protein
MSLHSTTPVGDENQPVALASATELKSATTLTAPAVSVRGILAVAWPLIVINLSITGMGFADAIMVAPLGEAALAAIYPALMVYLIPVVFGHGILGVVNSYVAQSVGSGQPLLSGRYAVQGVGLGGVLGLLLLPQLWLAPAYFRWMGHAPDVQALEVSYFQWLLPSAAPSLVVVALSSFFTGILRPRVLVEASLLATALNIALNYLLILGRHGFPAMGVAGAALGTSLATVVQMAYLLARFLSPALRASHGTGDWRADAAALRELLKVGSPAGLLPVFDLLTWGVFVLWMIGLFGTSHLAANTIVVRYLHLAFMPAFALASVLTALVGQSIGAGSPARARRSAALTYRILATYMGAVGLVFVLLREPLMRLFTSDPVVINAGAAIFFCSVVYQAFDAMWINYSHALRGAGDTAWPSAAVLVLGSTVLVGGSWFMVSVFPELESLGPWVATTVYTILLGCTMGLRWRAGGWASRRLVGAASTSD